MLLLTIQAAPGHHRSILESTTVSYNHGAKFLTIRNQKEGAMTQLRVQTCLEHYLKASWSSEVQCGDSQNKGHCTHLQNALKIIQKMSAFLESDQLCGIQSGKQRPIQDQSRVEPDTVDY